MNHLGHAHKLLADALQTEDPIARELLLVQSMAEALLHIGNRLDRPVTVRGSVTTSDWRDWPGEDGS